MENHRLRNHLLEDDRLLHQFLEDDTFQPAHPSHNPIKSNHYLPDTEEQYQMMVWWRCFCKMNNIQWITTSEEARIEKQARIKGMLTTYGHLKKTFGYLSSSSDDSSSSDNDNK